MKRSQRPSEQWQWRKLDPVSTFTWFMIAVITMMLINHLIKHSLN